MPSLEHLIQQARDCRLCETELEHGCRPVLRATRSARLLIVGQAPGIKVHESGRPWNDASGKRLREWLNVDEGTFYDDQQVAIIPAGLCYPGKGKSGDLPPVPRCAPLWHARLRPKLENIELTLLIGQYAQNHYLGSKAEKTLTETVRNWRHYLPHFLPLPHPSPRNQLWLKRNSWFDEEVIPILRQRIQQLELTP